MSSDKDTPPNRHGASLARLRLGTPIRSQQLVRLDPTVEPTMYRGAIASRSERESLAEIENVVRKGQILRMGSSRIELEKGSIPTGSGEIHVDCTAAGLNSAPARPIFEPGRITLQSIRFGLTCFNAALIAFVEASRADDAEKNRLCPPHRLPYAAVDWIGTKYNSFRAEAALSDQPDIAAWVAGSRLNLQIGLADHGATRD